MIDEPAWRGGRLISLKPARAGGEQAQVVAGLGQLDGNALEHAGQLHEGAAVLRGLDQVGRGDHRNAADFGQVAADMAA
jgi:hypothetical protein